ncbi:ABC transporter ATP-binding protein [Thermodesulfomicrobium sp. WS]|nr:ABC transporter ATP-binding protein [Thermodesulfomicrobium sp. WS]BDV01282.1 ABC transporter ATP-binding protein [Thermodesulfomicrobium sp. WS]
MHTPMITVHDLSLTLISGAAPVNVLQNLSFQVESGESVAVVGPSGSGKTSLLMLLSGLERPSAGSIHVAGHDLSSMGEDGLARFRQQYVGIVFQNFLLLPALSAEDNVALPLELAGVSDARKRARQALIQVGLEHRLHHLPSQLSGGEQQRVAVARAFAGGPALILADEPTGNLDAATGARVMELLFALHEEHGTTLLLVTHDPALAARCQRRMRLAGGRMEDV